MPGAAPSFAFLTAAERASLGTSLALIEEREAESVCASSLPAGVAREPPARSALVAPIPELDGAAVAADPALVGALIASGQPVIVRGLANALSWPACAKWASAEVFCAHYARVPFKLTELRLPAAMGRQKPLPLRLPLGVYAQYADATRADFPWYCFGDDFCDERAAFLADFSVPPACALDLYELNDSLRAAFPVYRYMCIGGARTGSNLHVDPDFTAAWNALLAGTKRWALFPPTAPREQLGVPQSGVPPLGWWLEHYERLASAPELGMLECEQRPGDVIFVPAGWWHCVLNCVGAGLTIAVTQNSLPPQALGGVWPQLVEGNPWLAAAIAREP